MLGVCKMRRDVMQLAGTPLLVHGQAMWTYDARHAAYQSIDFQHVTRTGANTGWSWIRGTEIVLGAAAGISLTAGTVIATRGLNLGATILLVGPPSVASGIASVASLSEFASEFFDSDEKIQPPESPPPPELPNNSSPNGNILIAALSGNSITGTVSGRYELNGTVNPPVA